ncbi:hypothetical protein GobsT_25670 [Gemmata obscuriglobus]|nr:hypothetical protein GobsT_25670 [Gemmata obscuriglobus]
MALVTNAPMDGHQPGNKPNAIENKPTRYRSSVVRTMHSNARAMFISVRLELALFRPCQFLRSRCVQG